MPGSDNTAGGLPKPGASSALGEQAQACVRVFMTQEQIWVAISEGKHNKPYYPADSFR